MLRYLLDKFCDEKFWLPPNTTWSDVAPAPEKEVVYNDHRHLAYAFPLAVLLTVLRYTLEKHLFAPFGRSLGIKDAGSKRAPDNPKLEAAYRASPSLKQEQIYTLAKQLDLSEREVERWLRVRRSQDRPSTLTKFCESSWRCSFLTACLVFEIWLLWSKDWPWDTDLCFVGYPHQGITNDVWWFYMIITGYFWSLFVCQFWDVRRKDFWQVFLHHVATIILLTFSWVSNLHRIGTMVLLTHDFSDVLLEGLKAAKYAGFHKSCDYLFAVFAVVWFAMRLVIFPFHVLSRMFRFAEEIGGFPVIYILNVFLCTLLVLNIYWTWLIIQVIRKTIKTGQVEGDIRSENSDDDTNTRAPDSRTIRDASRS